MTELEEKKRYENEYETARGEAPERTRQEEEKRQLEEKQQAETLLQQIEELKLQETKVILTFSSFENSLLHLEIQQGCPDLFSPCLHCREGFPCLQRSRTGYRLRSSMLCGML